ncbi:hypothetical protein [Duganella sp. Leaf61]|uniref:hypothetical protein n=1 Tax=Duganella sp. Leaf61 TaxID=1736227 RepID=UPI000B27FEA5|nr:hypothetical protein [Duganella sp. Leaf61]
MFTKQFLNTATIFGSASTEKPALNDLLTISGAVEQPLHECYFEDGANSGLPAFVVPYNDDEESFFADVATYYPAWSPVTAHIHVLRKEQIPEKIATTRARTKAKTNIRPEKVTLSIWSALAYSEAASLCVIHNLTEQEPSYGLCRRTLAFSLARASSLYPAIPTPVVTEKWNKLRAITHGEPIHLLIETVDFLSSVLKGVPQKTSNDQFGEVLPFFPDLDFRQFLTDDDYIGRYLLEYHPLVENAASELSGDFDRRMEAFQKIVDLVMKNPHSQLIDTVTIGFFANRILPGSMRYMRVLGRLLGNYQSLLVWYGFFSALSERYTSESAALAIDRKLQRDITQYFDLRISPQVDISIDEFHTISRVGLKSIALRPVQPRSLFVSLLPGIDVHVRLNEEFSDSDNKDSENLRQLKQRDRLLANVLNEAQKLLNTSLADDQFSPKSSKSRYIRDRY